MQPARFASEADFQGLLARFPELLVGDQIDPEDPRRWVLVKREQAVGLDQADGARWAIDHVFLDQDGIPTLVEIKRIRKSLYPGWQRTLTVIARCVRRLGGPRESFELRLSLTMIDVSGLPGARTPPSPYSAAGT